MASELRFDNCVLGSTTVTTAEFLSGSGRIMLAGDDESNTTADGRIHWNRRKVNPSAECALYGDKTTVESAVGLGVVSTFKRTTSTVKSFTGTVAAVYDVSQGTTRISVKGNPSDS